MIKPPVFKERSDTFLNTKLKKCLNRLNLRDWAVDLYLGDEVPEKFAGDEPGDSPAMVVYEAQYKMARIWVSPERSRRDNVDPLFYLYHEIIHIFLGVHDEEFECNNIASILLG